MKQGILAPEPTEFAERTRRKIHRRLIPILLLLYTISHLDRFNIGFAGLEMTKELRFSNEVFGFGGGIFFLGYWLLEIPGAVLVERWSARKWIARIMLTWGLAASLTGLIHTPREFYWARFFLGVGEAGLLPGALLRNASLKFVCELVQLRVENATTLFTNQYTAGDTLRIPIAHGDGQYVADPETIDRLEGEGSIVFRYIGGPADADAWWSPNGSMRAIAGIVNDGGNVLGMMPHPERAMDPLLGSGDGRGVFESILARVSA